MEESLGKSLEELHEEFLTETQPAFLGNYQEEFVENSIEKSL